VEFAVGLELTKLLLQVAYADDVVTAPERTALLAAAQRLAGDAGVALVEDVLAGSTPLPPPNLALLADHRTESLREVGRIAAVDGLHDDEIALMKTIAEMLR
jgi:hypothetical protein